MPPATSPIASAPQVDSSAEPGPSPARPAPAPPPTAEAAPWPPAPPNVTSDFCLEMVSALDERTCYVLPERPTDELMVYLHGIVPPTKESRQKRNLETVVANACRRSGVAALIPRGRRGLAPQGHDGWWGWPTTADGYAKWTSELTLQFQEARTKLESLTRRRFTRLYVAGSSSGAYFAVALALRNGIEADAFAAISGGALPAAVDPAKAAPKPFYIGYGTSDPASRGALALAQRLRGLGWSVEVGAHPTGHGAREIYLDEAFAFWRRSLK